MCPVAHIELYAPFGNSLTGALPNVLQKVTRAGNNHASGKMQVQRNKVSPTLVRRVRRVRAANGPDEGHPGHRPIAHGPQFRPGDPVRQSGIYEVIHGGEHRQAHEVVMLKGTAFPTCDTCSDDVRFRLVRTAPYIFQDGDFEEQD